MKVLLDEMWSPRIAEQLNLRGFDVIAAADRADLRQKADPVVFAFAVAEERALVTEDKAGFRNLATAALYEERIHFGLILTSSRTFARSDPRIVGRMVNALTLLLSSGTDLTNREIWLSP